MAKQVDFMDGANSSTTPTIGNVDTTNLACYADDAAYEAANAGAPTEGNIYCNTTDNTIHYYNGTAWTELADDDTAQTFTNKTIDGTATGTNTVTIDASDAEFDNTVSGLTATDVKAAIDEVEGRVDTAETDITTAQGSADANTTDISDIRTTQGTSDGDTDMGTFTGTTLTDNTDVKTLLQELETAVEAVGGALVFAGTWNANTNTPTLSDGTGTAGEFYIVSVAGTTSLDGISDWAVNDWAIFDGTVWRKIDNSELVTSVNGQTGNAVLDINDIDDVNTGGVGARYRLQRNSLNTLWIDFNPYSNQTDATSGSNVTLSSIVEEGTKRLTSGTLVSVDMIPASFQGDSFVLLNDTGVAITLNNETGATAADQILTGSGGPIVLKDGASIGMIYDANISVQKWRLIGGPGGGTGGVSGIITGDDSTADTTAGDWATYADAADTIPVDGTGGSPNITLARTTVSTEILQGAGSFEITKGAFNRQGEGVSLDIAAPKYIRGQASQISFSYDATDAGGAVVHTDEFLTTDTTLAFGADFIGQTFLTTAAYTPNKVGMILHKNGLTPTGNYQLHLYATSGGVPTGSPIASTALLDAAALPSTASGIQSFNLVTPVALTDATTYAIVIEEISLVGNINVDRTGASVYPSGGRVTSADGITWGGPFTGDYAFSISEDTTVGFDFGNPADPVGSPSDMSVFLYDVTNSKLLTPSETGIFGGGLFKANVQIPSDCEDVRVIFHIATTSALAYDFVFDRVQLDVAPSEFNKNSSDWIDYTPIFTNWVESAVDFKYRQDGPDLLISGTFTSGSPAAGEQRITLPAGFVSKTALPTISRAGDLFSSTISTNVFRYGVLKEPGVNYFTVSRRTGTTTGDLVKSTGQVGLSQISLFARIPCEGLTSGVSHPAASGLNAQAVMRARKNGGAVTADTDIPSWDEVAIDTVGAFNATTGVYTVKSPGNYKVDLHLQNSVTGVVDIVLNGTPIVRGGGVGTRGDSSCILPDLKYGDQITARSNQTGTLGGAIDRNVFSIFKIGSEQQPYAPRVAYLKDVKAAATNGGTFTSGAWQTRDLNTVEGDASFVSLSANQFTLQPGTYDIESASPALSVNSHKAKLRDITNTVDTIIGHSAWASNTNVVGNLATITGRFTITAATTFEIQHRCEITSATFGFGADSNFGVDEVYTQVKITKVL